MCKFCDIIKKGELLQDKTEKAVCMFDNYPVTRYHMLFMPTRHKQTYFDLTSDEIMWIDSLMVSWKEKLEERDPSITGWNIGWNCGVSAGQTIDHTHCHLIPRRDKDIDNPVGGVRGVIPEKRVYK